MRSTLKTLLTAVGALGLALLPAASPAWATDPVSIPSGTNIVDPTNALGSRKGDVQKAIDDLRSQRKVNFYVVIVDDFTNPTDRTAWATAVYNKKGMGVQDVLLTIESSGQYFLGASKSNTKISSKTANIIQNALVPNLGGSKPNYAQAAIDTANAVGDAAGGGNGDVSTFNPAPLLVGGGIVVVAGAAGAYALSRRRKNRVITQAIGADGTPDPLAGLSLDELRKRASGLLVQADDAIKSSEQELGFAEASYGTDAVGNFSEALADAKAQLSESFKLQQQLDDHIPDTPEQQRAWLTEIIQRSEGAIGSLADQKTDFDALRELERNAPAALDNVAAGVARATARLAGAEQTLATLAAEYAPSAVKQVSDNISQAKDRLAFVESASAQARGQLRAGETGAAAVSVRAAEEALHQSGVLLDAIDKASASISAARTNLDSALADTESDLAQAKAMVQDGQHAELAGPIAGVESVLAQAKQELAGGKIDPVALLARIEKAHQQLDDVLAGVRDKEQQAQRAAASLQQAIRSAQDAIGATSDYIAARRGGVGTEARTRLAEAQRNLDYALSIAQSDPTSALAYAEQANSLAQQAAQLAEQDVDQFAGFGGFGMGGGRNYGGGIGGAILGGILIDNILNAGHHHGDTWGGGGWGGDGGGGFGGGGWGGDGGGFGGGDGGGFGGDGGSF
ncbi:TPM domain-containing protein [Sinomonas sp. JGH33]|uniref:TPM domain-containing protein n=1 Tax=Sinomonas terricola TaxID=3110330 RepID=A0ABU5T0F8_9MICC|nr:TPM domain-containing protein [Sinomonas sp. JGH33]MEA5453137.1 TPM domain-containing protein [Sinomonas sp. JGH33]